MRKPSLIGKDGHDREGFGLSLEETGEKLNMSKYAVWERERDGIRNLWRFSVDEKLRNKRIEALITRLVIAREESKT